MRNDFAKERVILGKLLDEFVSCASVEIERLRAERDELHRKLNRELCQKAARRAALIKIFKDA